MNNKVAVGICLRPLAKSELDSGADNVIKILDSKRVILMNDASSTSYEYDCAFSPGIKQRRVIFDEMIAPLTEWFFEGYNATVLAYGQTGSGKTHTMGSSIISIPASIAATMPTGADLDENLNEGILPFAIKDFFIKKAELEETGAVVDISMSYVEIYNEKCYDLLSAITREKSRDNVPKNMTVRDNAQGETVLEGLSVMPVTDQQEASRLLCAASAVRATGSTAMNATSSRSHAICTFYLKIATAISGSLSTISAEGRDRLVGVVTSSKFHLVDLAGTERITKTNATGETLTEGININKGLLALGNVVEALSVRSSRRAPEKFISYRDSLLTRLLKDSLGGNGMTVMLACISPAGTQAAETKCTLEFASRATQIVNKASKNEVETLGDLPPFVCYSCGTLNPADGIDPTDRISSEISDSERKYLADQASTLERKCELLKKQIELQRLNFESQLKEKSAKKESEKGFLVGSSALPLSSALRSLLLKCFEEDVEVESGELESVHADIRALRENLGLPPSSDMNLSNNAIPTSSPSTCAHKIEKEKNKMHENASLSVSDLTGSNVECSEVKEENICDDSDSTGNSSLDGSSINNFDENQFSQELAMTFDGFDFNFFTPPILLLVDELAFLERDLNLLSARTAAERHPQKENICRKRKNFFSQATSSESGNGNDKKSVKGTKIRKVGENADLNLLSVHQGRESGSGLDSDCGGSTTLESVESESVEIVNEDIGEEDLEIQDETDDIDHEEDYDDFSLSNSRDSSLTPGHGQMDNTSAGLTLKEKEVCDMLLLSQSYESMIGSLRNEIVQLQSDRNCLERTVQASAATAGDKTEAKGLKPSSVQGQNPKELKTSVRTAVTDTDQSLRRELKEKSKLLEEKLKLLRLKEAEFRRVSLSKDKAAKEALVLRANIEEAKRARNILQKRLKEEGSNHNAEKKKLQHSQSQSEQREMATKHHLFLIEEELLNKQKVWKAQLAVKTRESKELKDQIEKQEKVQNHRKQFQNTGHSSALTIENAEMSSTTTSLQLQGSAESQPLSSLRIKSLKAWLKEESDRQKDVQTEHDNIIHGSTDRFSNIKSLSEAKFLLNILFSQAAEKNVPHPPILGTTQTMEMKMNTNSLLALVKESYLSEENKMKNRLSQFNDGAATDTTSGRKGGVMSSNVLHDKLNKNRINATSSNNVIRVSNKNNSMNANSSVKQDMACKIANTQKCGNISSSSLNNAKTKAGHVLISGNRTGDAMKGHSGSSSHQFGQKQQQLPLAKSALTSNINSTNRSTKVPMNNNGIRPKCFSSSNNHVERKNTAANVAASIVSMTASIKDCLPPQGGLKIGTLNPLQKVRKLNQISVDEEHGIKRIKKDGTVVLTAPNDTPVLNNECQKNIEEKRNHFIGDEVVDSENGEDGDEGEGGADLDYESQSDDEADESFYPEEGDEEEDEEESDTRRRRTVRRNVPGKGSLSMEHDYIEEEEASLMDISDADGYCDEMMYSSMDGEEVTSIESARGVNSSTDNPCLALSGPGTQLLQSENRRDRYKKSENYDTNKISVFSDNATDIDNENSELSIEQKRRKIPLQENSLYLVGEKKKPYYYYTVSELKSLLKERKLIVSGRKDDLVQRLMQYDESQAEHTDQIGDKVIGSYSAQDNKENVENSENTGNRPIIKMKLLGLGKNTFGLLHSLQDEDMVEKEVEWF